MLLDIVKNSVKSLTPPLIWNLLRENLLRSKARQHVSFKYGFRSWDEASREIPNTYADESIIEKVRTAALRVKSGEYPFERDGVLFDHVVPNWQLNYLIFMHLQQSNSSSLHILDFGGGLGTSYHQFKNSTITDNLQISWVIVEQENFTRVGQREFSTRELSFLENLECCAFDQKFIAIALGVLQYLQDPFHYLQKLIDLNPEYIFIDATPFSRSGDDSISLQFVPSSIYSAAYVAHVFSWKNFITFLEIKYVLICFWDCAEQPDPKNFYKGAIFRKI
jgi:putative methyltransferase (TIGR04325 family)